MVSARFSVSRSYVIKARQCRERHGDACAGAQRSHTPAKLVAHGGALRARVETAPDATLAELVERASAELGITLSMNALWKRLKALNLMQSSLPILLAREGVR